jgi:hypothetical protein
MMHSVSRLARRFCATLATATAEISGEAAASVPTKAKKHRSIYKKLSSLGTRGGGKMEETLNQFVMEGVPVKKHDLIRYAKDLRKFRQPQRALEVCLLFPLELILATIVRGLLYRKLKCV